jgi:hypothetical protein
MNEQNEVERQFELLNLYAQQLDQRRQYLWNELEDRQARIDKALALCDQWATDGPDDADGEIVRIFGERVRATLSGPASPPAEQIRAAIAEARKAAGKLRGYTVRDIVAVEDVADTIALLSACIASAPAEYDGRVSVDCEKKCAYGARRGGPTPCGGCCGCLGGCLTGREEQLEEAASPPAAEPGDCECCATDEAQRYKRGQCTSREDGSQGCDHPYAWHCNSPSGPAAEPEWTPKERMQSYCFRCGIPVWNVQGTTQRIHGKLRTVHIWCSTLRPAPTAGEANRG